MTPLQRALMLSFFTSGIAAVAGSGPAAPPGATLLHVAPAVRRIVRTLRQIDIPPLWRRRNWTGDRGQGSCVHAALVHLWHWQGRHDVADWWATHYGNGETADGLAFKLEQAGVKFAETRSGDEAFLEWALRTRRGAAVVVQNGAHMVNLVGLDGQHAHLLDSNFPDRIQRVPRAEFLHEWKQSGGWAVTPVGTPPPPDPWIVKARVCPHPNPLPQGDGTRLVTFDTAPRHSSFGIRLKPILPSTQGANDETTIHHCNSGGAGSQRSGPVEHLPHPAGVRRASGEPGSRDRLL